MKRKLIAFILPIMVSTITTAQNYSGLQFQKLTALDDISAFVESQLGSLFGKKISGKIDSVVVTWDSEKTLKARIYYKDFLEGYFTVSALNNTKQKQNEVVAAKFNQSTSPSPFECTLQLASGVPKGTKIESAFLRIEVAKKENGFGNVSVYTSRKNWKNELDPQNVVVNAILSPVGKAGLLTEQVKDVTPTKTIQFDPKILYRFCAQ